MKSYLPLMLAAGLATSLIGWLPHGGAVGERPPVSVFKMSAPRDAEHLRTIEQTACEVAERVIPCTVGLEVGRAQGSGVIISADGYVLTAAHVVGRPGVDVKVRLADGTELKGVTLGMHTAVDGGLVKITEEGELPFAPLVPGDEGPQTGQWCLATGHPSGFQLSRSAPVRVGRVIDVTPDVIRTDCVINGGDSGGPLFDMQGRVIGIHSRISVDMTVNLHAPVLACIESWERLKNSEVFPIVPSRFLAKLDANHDGLITRNEQTNDTHREVFDRLAAQFSLAEDEAHSIEDLMQVFDWRPAPYRDFGRNYAEEERVGESLMKELFVRGERVISAFSELASRAMQSTVEVECNRKLVGLGTVVSEDGLILTKASDLTEKIRCRLPSGRRYTAELVSEDKENDFALLRINVTRLTPVQFASTENLRAGSWLLTPGRRRIESVGVLSVNQREIAGEHGVLGILLDEVSDRARIARVFPDSGAEAAGFQVHDVITKINGKPVHSIAELKQALALFRKGDVVEVTIQRQGRESRHEVTLGAREEVFAGAFFGGVGRMMRVNGPLSRRRDGFPGAFQHDSVLPPAKCGGPVVDSLGNVVGINIARADRIATYSVPSEEVQSILEKLKQAVVKTTAGD